MKRTHRAAQAVSLLALLALPASAAGGDLVVEAGRIITQSGAEIEDGVIVIQAGRITAVGAASEVKRPWDAPVVGGEDLVAFPGFVEACTWRGLDRPNESIDVAPFLDVRDSVDPVSFFFEDALRGGLTTLSIQQGSNCVVGARGMVVHPVGMTVEEMSVRAPFGLVLSATPKSGHSRATQAQALRKAFTDLRQYLEGVVRDTKDGKDKARREALFQGRDLESEENKGRAMTGTAWKVEGLETVPRGALDEKQRPLLDVVEGRLAVFVHCGAPMDVKLALDVARENGFLHRTTLVLEPACWKAADLIAEAGVPVVLDPQLVHVERDPRTGKEVETFVPGVFEARGVRFALSSESSAGRLSWYQAALATGLGLERRRALDAVTVVPAEILGLGDRLGRIEAGYDGNVVLFTGDPLDVTSWVEHVVIDGVPVYHRSEDVRLKHLYEGVEPRKAAGAAAAGGR